MQHCIGADDYRTPAALFPNNGSVNQLIASLGYSCYPTTHNIGWPSEKIERHVLLVTALLLRLGLFSTAMLKLAPPDRPLRIDIKLSVSVEDLEAIVKEEPPPAPRVTSFVPGAPGPSTMARVYSDDEHQVESPRSKAMIPPRPRREHITHPGGPASVRKSESWRADSCTKMRPSVGFCHSESYNPFYPTPIPGLCRAVPDVRAVPPRAAAERSAESDLGGLDGLEAKVVLLGSQGVGKTSLIQRYTTRTFDPTPHAATIGSFLHTRKLVHDGVRVKLQIWDTAGQERFRSMAPIYYRGAHVCVLVYDTTDRLSFDDVRSWLDELARTVPKETVIFVVGAKIDRPDRQVT
jgi:small GTP-binding protein